MAAIPRKAHVTLTVDGSVLEAELERTYIILQSWCDRIAAQELALDLKLKKWGKEIAAMEKRSKKVTRKAKAK